MREINMIEAIREALDEEMARCKDVVLLGEDIGVLGGIYRVTQGLLAKYGSERVRDTPISEEGFVGLAVGAAATGLRPVVEIMYSDFLANCMNQVVNYAAKMHYCSGGQVNVPLVIRCMVGHGRGHGGDHSQVPIPWFLNIPGLNLLTPSNPRDAKGILKTAIRADAPSLFFEPHLLYRTKSAVPVEEYTVPIGKATIREPGTDITAVAISAMVPRVLEARSIVGEQGISMEVIDPVTIRPLDLHTITESVKKTNRLVTVEYSPKTGGIGAEIAAAVIEEAFDYLDAPIRRVAAPDCPVPVSPPLEKMTVPSVESIVSVVKEMIL